MLRTRSPCGAWARRGPPSQPAGGPARTRHAPPPPKAHVTAARRPPPGWLFGSRTGCVLRCGYDRSTRHPHRGVAGRLISGGVRSACDTRSRRVEQGMHPFTLEPLRRLRHARTAASPGALISSGLRGAPRRLVRCGRMMLMCLRLNQRVRVATLKAAQHTVAAGRTTARTAAAHRLRHPSSTSIGARERERESYRAKGRSALEPGISANRIAPCRRQPTLRSQERGFAVGAG